MILIRTILVIITISLMIFVTSCSESGDSDRPPNIIIVFADDLGYGDLSCYGHPNINTVHLDRMADEGIRFTSFYAAASVCTPSRAALLTGRYPIRNAPHNFGPESKNGLPLSEITLANILNDAGYTSMAIGKWHLGHLPEYLPTARGFDHYYGLPYSNDMILPWCPWLTENNILHLYKDSDQVRVVGFEQDDLTLEYTNEAVKFITKHKDQPFFLYLAHSMPHLPISTSKEFIGKSKGGLYGDVVETIDWSVGEILSTLKELDIDEKTIVVFTSDNGPWHNLPDRMLQKGVERWHTGSTGLLRGAKGTTYEGGFRVPAIIRWPGKIPKGNVTNEIATTMDLFTTFVRLGEGSLPSDIKIDGNDISSLLMGGKRSTTNRMFYLRGTQLQAVRDMQWKLRYTESNGFELFNLEEDPAEMYNRIDQFPERIKKMHQELIDFATETNATMVLK